MTTSTLDLNFEHFANHLPPCNVDAEEAILGGILLESNLLSSQAIERVASILEPDDFYINAHKTIYEVCLKLHRQGQSPDLMHVATHLGNHKLLEEVGGQSKLARLVDQTVSAINIDRYAELVKEKSLRRQLIKLGNALVKNSYNNVVETPDVIKSFQNAFDNVKSEIKQENKELAEYSRLVKAIREIELADIDPGAKSYLLTCRAKEFRLSVKDIENVYFKSLIDKDNEPSQSLEEFFSKYSDTERKWLMNGFLPKGITAILHARGGVGKTLLAYHLAHRLLTGQDFNQFTVTSKKRKALLIQTDEAPEDLSDRLRKIGFTDNLDLKIKTKWTFDHVASLRKEIERERPEFIIIDSITSNSKHSTVSENDVIYSKPVLLLNEIAAEFGCTILMIHHSSYEGNARGTTALFNAVGLVVKLENDPREGCDPMERILTFQKARSRSTAKYRLRMDWEDNSWSVLQEEGENPDGAAASTKSAILEHLARHRGVIFEAEDLSHELGYGRDSIRREAGQLAGAGLISMRAGRKGSPSKYFLPLLENADLADLSDLESQKTYDQNISHTGQGFQNADLSDHGKSQICEKSLCENSKNGDQHDQHFETHTGHEELLIMDSDHTSEKKADQHKNSDRQDQHFSPDQKNFSPDQKKQNNSLSDEDMEDMAESGFISMPDQVEQIEPDKLFACDLAVGDAVATKKGSRMGWISKVKRRKGSLTRFEIIWGDESEVTYTLEEMNMAGFVKLEDKK